MTHTFPRRWKRHPPRQVFALDRPATCAGCGQRMEPGTVARIDHRGQIVHDTYAERSDV